MLRLFLNIDYGNSVSADDEGADFPSVEDGILEARHAVRELVIESIRDKRRQVPKRIAITDADGAERASVDVAEILPPFLRRVD